MFVPFSAVIVAKTSSVISPTTTSLEPSGNLALKSADVATSVAFAFATSFTLSTEAPFCTSTSPVAFGNTNTGTSTVSLIFVPFELWVTVVGILRSAWPTFPTVLNTSASLGLFTVPGLLSIVAGLTEVLTSSFVILSPSNTTNLSVVDFTTFTSMSTVVS